MNFRFPELISEQQRRRLLSILFITLVLSSITGCVPETVQATKDYSVTVEQANDSAIVDTPTSEVQAEDTSLVSPESGATETDLATAEALEEILESELLEASTQPAPGTPFLDGTLLLQPTSSKPDGDALERINFARASLVQESGAETSQMELVAYEEVVWRDGSLGCPQPGMMYTQALVDGYVIQLNVDGQTFNYHGANSGDPFLCTNNAETTEPPPSIPRGGQLATPPVKEE